MQVALVLRSVPTARTRPTPAFTAPATTSETVKRSAGSARWACVSARHSNTGLDPRKEWSQLACHARPRGELAPRGLGALVGPELLQHQPGGRRHEGCEGDGDEALGLGQGVEH